MTGPLPRPGDTALLLLADMLDKADERHKARGEPSYRQDMFFHRCGTPACAVGHWLAAEGHTDCVGLIANNYMRLLNVFGLKSRAWAELFGSTAPNSSAQEAAARIRTFVKARSPVPVA